MHNAAKKGRDMNYAIIENEPGYLPDTPPVIVNEFDEAQVLLCELIQCHLDDCIESFCVEEHPTPDHTRALIAEYEEAIREINEWNSPNYTGPLKDGYVYEIQATTEPVTYP